jgi:hypothetical protein
MFSGTIWQRNVVITAMQYKLGGTTRGPKPWDYEGFITSLEIVIIYLKLIP